LVSGLTQIIQPNTTQALKLIEIEKQNFDFSAIVIGTIIGSMT
jgi:hypothetical protein